MPGVIGGLSLAAGILLVAISSAGVAARLRFQNNVAAILAVSVIAYAQIVLLAQILSELGQIHRAGFLVGHALAALILLRWIWPARRLLKPVSKLSKTQIWRRAAAHPGLALLGSAVLATLLLGAYLNLAVPPNTYDSLSSSLPRVARWLEQETLRHFLAYNLKQVTFPINAEVGLLWLTALWGNDRLGAFVQWGATLLTMVAIYGLARLLQFSRPASLFAAIIWSTLTVVVVQATSTKNDTLVACFCVAAIYFLLAGLRRAHPNENASFMLFGLSFGLALGVKPLAAMLAPGLVIFGVVLLLHCPRRYLRGLLVAALWSIIGFALLGSYNYLLNWINYGSVNGPPQLSNEHLTQSPTLLSFVTGSGQIIYHFFDLGGLPQPLVDFLQPWRARAGQTIFAAAGLVPTEARFDFADPRHVTPREDAAWYGPLGFLLVWPTLLYYLVIMPFAGAGRLNFFQRDMWKWAIALISVSYVITFAFFFRWNPWIGRMFMVAVALGSPLLAGFYTWSENYKPLRGAVYALAGVVLIWSATHNLHKPVFGPASIWNLDYYDLRAIQEPEMANIYRQVDAQMPPDAALGLAGEWPAMRWEYLFLGPNLSRNYAYLGGVPRRVTPNALADHQLDYLVLASDRPEAVDSELPLHPLGRAWGLHWYLTIRGEADWLAAQRCPPNLSPQAFGAGYQAYQAIRQTLKQQGTPFRVLTTDFRMFCYDHDQRFVFDTPTGPADLQQFTHLILPRWWSPADFERFGLSLDSLQTVLLQENLVQEVLTVNGYVLYKIQS